MVQLQGKGKYAFTKQHASNFKILSPNPALKWEGQKFVRLRVSSRVYDVEKHSNSVQRAAGCKSVLALVLTTQINSCSASTQAPMGNAGAAKIAP